MAKSYYSMDEAREALDMSETQIKDLVRSGKLREFRDGANVTYKAEDIDKLAQQAGGGEAGGSGELILEPADDTGIDLASTGSETGIDLSSTGSDAISLSESDVDSDATAVGEEAPKKDKKDDTVVSSVGVSVFEDDDTDVSDADPVAETVVSEGSTGIEGIGSGSGLLDLTRESDDTSLGPGLLDEILPEGGDSAEMGEATRAGLDEITAEPEEDTGAGVVSVEETPAATAEPTRVPATAAVESGVDPLEVGLTGLLAAAVLVMCIMGLSAAAMMHDAVPQLLVLLQKNMLIFGGAALGVAAIATGIGFLLGKRSA